ncbi:MAG: ABC transporter permease, partial [Psychrosphaera sp.]|nr:ABC transporter permease [Psychrosphaera sp.]
AVRWQSLKVVDLAAVGLMLFNEISGNLILSADAGILGVLADPFGFELFVDISRYWTVPEKNNNILAFSGVLMHNRLLWLTIGLLVLWFFGRLTATLTVNDHSVKTSKSETGSKKEKINKTLPDKTIPNQQPLNTAVNHKIDVTSNQNVLLPQLLARIRFEVKQVIFDPAFYILCGTVLIFLMTMMITMPHGMFDNTVWPLTHVMVETSRKALGALSLIVITYYSGEIIWRENHSKIGDIVDSLPVKNVSFWLSKLVAMFVVLLILIVSTVLLLITYQVARGYGNALGYADLGQYAISMFYFTLLPWFMMAVVAFLCQVLSPNKYIGMFLFVLFIIADFALSPLGLGHNLFRFSHSPSWSYSDMNGYGQAIVTHSWYMLYWGALTVVLAVLSYGLWQRGPQQTLKVRIGLLRYQMISLHERWYGAVYWQWFKYLSKYHGKKSFCNGRPIQSNTRQL